MLIFIVITPSIASASGRGADKRDDAAKFSRRAKGEKLDPTAGRQGILCKTMTRFSKREMRQIKRPDAVITDLN